MAIQGSASRTGSLDPAEALLAAATDAVRRERQGGAEQLAIAYRWALTHRTELWERGDEEDAEGVPAGRHGRTRLPDTRTIGAAGYVIDEYCPAELAGVLGMSVTATQRLMADAVDLHNRLPQTWTAVETLLLPVWVARKIAALTHDLSDEAARAVDAEVAGHFGSLTPGRLFPIVAGRVVAADPALADAKAEARRAKRGVWLGRPVEGSQSLIASLDGADAKRVLATCDRLAQILADAESDAAGDSDDGAPATLDQLRAHALALLGDPASALALLDGRDPRKGKAVVYAHLDATALLSHPDPTRAHGVARVEDLGPATFTMLRRLLGHDQVTLKPVIDLSEDVAADCYETPSHLAERVHLIKPADIFPFADGIHRNMDLDHTRPFDPHGPPGQTALTNLAKMTRRHHRIKTHGGWAVEHLPDHRYLWSSPAGRLYLVDHVGTRRIDNGNGAPTRSPAEIRADLILRDAVWAA